MSAIDRLHIAIITALSIFLSVSSSPGIRLTRRRWQTMLRILEQRIRPPGLLLLLLPPRRRDAINTSRWRTRHAPGRQSMTRRARTPITSLAHTSSHVYTQHLCWQELHAVGLRMWNNLASYDRTPTTEN